MIANRITILGSLIIFCALVFTDQLTKVEHLSYKVKTTKLECTVNPVWVTNFTCKLKPMSWDKSVANIKGTLLHPVKNVWMRVELFKYTNQFRPFIINVTVNACKWLDTKQYANAYARLFLSMMTKFTNVNHSCPYTGLIKAEGMYFDSRLAYFAIPPVITDNEDRIRVPATRDTLY